MLRNRLWWLCNRVARRSTNYELSSHKSSITSLQDDTILICCLQEDYGYKFIMLIYSLMVNRNNQIGDTTYLLVGEECEVTVPATNKTHTFNQYDCKLTSNNCSIKNISNNICH